MACADDPYTRAEVGKLLKFLYTPEGRAAVQRTTHFKAAQARQHEARRQTGAWAALVGQLWLNYAHTPAFELAASLQAVGWCLLLAAGTFAAPSILQAATTLPATAITKAVLVTVLLHSLGHGFRF